MKVQTRHVTTCGDMLRMQVQSHRHGYCFSRAVASFRIIETQISYILLTGPYAYKCKKPVNLGFLEVSAPAHRRFFCEEEVRLIQQLAPELCLGLAQATGELRHPELDGTDQLLCPKDRFEMGEQS